jgi:hypothetical protein
MPKRLLRQWGDPAMRLVPIKADAQLEMQSLRRVREHWVVRRGMWDTLAENMRRRWPPLDTNRSAVPPAERSPHSGRRSPFVSSLPQTTMSGREVAFKALTQSALPHLGCSLRTAGDGAIHFSVAPFHRSVHTPGACSRLHRDGSMLSGDRSRWYL